MVDFYFFDSSALVKRYVTEIGSAWVQAMTQPQAGQSRRDACGLPHPITNPIVNRLQSGTGLLRLD